MAYGIFGARRRVPQWASQVIRRDHVDSIPRGNLYDDQVRDIERISGTIPRTPPRAGVFGEQPTARVPDPSDASRRANFDDELAMQRDLTAQVRSAPKPVEPVTAPLRDFQRGVEPPAAGPLRGFDRGAMTTPPTKPVEPLMAGRAGAFMQARREAQVGGDLRGGMVDVLRRRRRLY